MTDRYSTIPVTSTMLLFDISVNTLASASFPRTSVRRFSYRLCFTKYSTMLTAAPAIAEYLVGLIGEKMPLAERSDAVTVLPRAPRLTELSDDEINALVAHNPAWGRIVCRCEKVTEAEIVAAVHSPVPAVTVDAVKRRVRAGMGRCQGGFCAPRVMEIIARETGVPLSAVRKGGAGSEIAVIKVGEADYD